MAWRENQRRDSNGNQFMQITGATLDHPHITEMERLMATLSHRPLGGHTMRRQEPLRLGSEVTSFLQIVPDSQGQLGSPGDRNGRIVACAESRAEAARTLIKNDRAT